MVTVNPAVLADVELRFHPLEGQEATNAETFLEDAWWYLQSIRSGVAAAIAADPVIEQNAIRILAMATRRVLMNPGGLLEEAIDDYRYRRDALVSGGALFFSDEELASVTPAVADPPSRRSVRLVAYGDF